MTHIVAQNVANLYAGPDTDLGLVSQTIFGDVVIAQAEADGFMQVRTADQYAGWLQSHTLKPAWNDSDYLSTTIATLFAEVYTAPDIHSELITKLVVGTRVVVAQRAEVGDWVPLQFSDPQIGYVHRVCLNVTHSTPGENLHQALKSDLRREAVYLAIGRQAVDTALRFVGTPYLWGGCTPFGIDCSGLTQLAYKLNGVQLLRDAYLQFADRRFRRVEEGKSLDTALLEDGDLIAFSRREDKRPTHIGIALGDGRFIHARGGRGVRIDFCDSEEYGETYLGAVRLSPDADLAINAA